MAKTDTLNIGSRSVYQVNCYYPEENDEQVIDDIACGLGYLGLFDCFDVKD